MLAVGFDLDLTLADTRKGIAAAFDRLSAETGVPIDTAAVVSRLGPPLETELAYWFPPEDVPELAARYRAFYGEVAVPRTSPMPGADAAVDAVRARGGRVIVVTAKNQRDAESTVRFLGLNVDAVAGGLFGAGKGAALVEFGATAYAGDHVADIDAARAAGARSIAIATGPYDSEALRAYGADIVLPDLRGFPDTLSELIHPGSPSRQ
ncbi:HAD hydrolase-like protein [Actinoallomurus purpureus]|uniref:HAD family hydrolase n=1 Tax=Actinoallomurus purpureus TaxID=478114 RepID=UPI002092A5A2|nr:HAD hydrolase-like protein [Actinoallomurus purpureus]MCO6010925.1 HAD hydrolase-like protein [Actinoallomurus purpureus]